MSKERFELAIAKELQAQLSTDDEHDSIKIHDLKRILIAFKRLKSPYGLDYVQPSAFEAFLRVDHVIIAMTDFHAFIGVPKAQEMVLELLRGRTTIFEQPEDGVYPPGIKEKIKECRNAGEERGAIRIFTYSPLVINEMQPNEVTLLTFDAGGNLTATRMDHIANFEDRIKGYALGELWLSYADGEREEALLKGGPAT